MQINKCTIDIVPEHYLHIKEDIKMYQRYCIIRNMYKCLNNGYAFYVNNSFIYLIKENHKVFGVYLYADNLLELSMLYKHICFDTDIDTIYDYPHNLKGFTSLCDLKSVRLHTQLNTPVEIRIKDVKDKILKVYNFLSKGAI